ncbi:MAG: NAD(P)-dependent oxidoreductase [Cephaloticoccus sp.]|nr:NAD(P)-dependent oxidoreductase [Cephaloticoccus sp.]MCF7761024.1 NAD(P)-dependent oxidoreductase [Cephaloticoccus sp.]
MKKIVVTGGSGKAGRSTVKVLQDAGYDVRNVDRVPSLAGVPTWQVDLTDYGQTLDAFTGAEAVVHLAAIPNDGIHPPERTFRENTLSTFNVFHAAVTLGLKRVVWASSETTLGLPFKKVLPKVAPIAEDHYPYPESSYSLSKIVGEAIAEQMARWSGIPFVGLRFSNVMEPADYAHFPSWQDDPAKRRWNLWGYIDARDAGHSCKLGLEAPIKGSENFIIAAADTCMLMPNTQLLAAEFPGCLLAPGTGENDSLLSIAKACRLLGFEPQYSWRTAELG